MADATDTIFTEATPLITGDAAALDADIIPQAFFQPSFVLRTDPRALTAANAGLAASGDVWRIMIAAPTSMPGYTFLPLALTASFALGTIASAFWSLSALYSIVPPVGTEPLRHAWRSFQLDSARTVFNGADNVRYQTASPELQGWPPSPVVATTAISALGGFQFTVGTFDAGELAAIVLSVDARWLAFPIGVLRNSAFYTSRQLFTPN